MKSYPSSCLGFTEGVFVMAVTFISEMRFGSKAVIVNIVLAILFCILNAFICKEKKLPTVIQGHTVDMEGVMIEAESHGKDETKITIAVDSSLGKIDTHNIVEIKTALSEYNREFQRDKEEQI